MEPVEILIFVGCAILLGALVLGFLTNWDYMSMYDDTKKMFDSNEDEFKTDRLAFANELHRFYEECVSTGFNMSQSIYIDESGLLTKAELFSVFKQLGWCDSIQSAENSCGVREDIVMPDIALPKVVRVNCTDGRLYLS